jgi:hypothetical protein
VFATLDVWDDSQNQKHKTLNGQSLPGRWKIKFAWLFCGLLIEPDKVMATI